MLALLSPLPIIILVVGAMEIESEFDGSRLSRESPISIEKLPSIACKTLGEKMRFTFKFAFKFVFKFETK